MSGTVSYDIVQLRKLSYDEITFVTNYINLISGNQLDSYDMSSMYNMLTGIDTDDEDKINNDINHILSNNYPVNAEIVNGRNTLLSLLQDPTIKHFISVNNQYNLLTRIIRSMNNTLPDDISASVLAYMKSISGDVNLSIDLINNTFKSVKFNRSDDNPYHIFSSMKDLIYDQMGHFKSDETDCNIWHIEGKHNDYELGSICVFYNSTIPMILDGKFGAMIQDIVKYPIPFLAQFLFPTYNPFIPKLNTVLETPINIVAGYIGVDYIFVRPIGNQGSILTKHYGYKETDAKFTYPCETISVGFSQWLYKEVDKGY